MLSLEIEYHRRVLNIPKSLGVGGIPIGQNPDALLRTSVVDLPRPGQILILQSFPHRRCQILQAPFVCHEQFFRVPELLEKLLLYKKADAFELGKPYPINRQLLHFLYTIMCLSVLLSE